MEKNKRVMAAADTIMSMCVDYKINKIGEEHFVNTLKMFAEFCEVQLGLDKKKEDD